jgi:hypothetical protein
MYDMSFILYGQEFKYGKCCVPFHGSNIQNECQYVATIPNTDKAYCKYHYRDEEKKHRLLEKTKKQEEQSKLLDEMNAKRVANGLKPLKHFKSQNKNVVQSTQQIGEYVPEPENNNCNAILKTGVNKGKQCCLKIHNDGLCKRHYNTVKNT